MAEGSVPVWPRMDPSTAAARFDVLLAGGIDEARELVDLSVEAMRFYETATHRVDSKKLNDLREKVINLASEHGFPRTRSKSGGLTFDQQLAVLFSDEVPMLEIEASMPEVWNFLTLRAFPDVAWRWPGSEPDAMIDADGTRLRTHRLKETRRNVFRQAWFRQDLLGVDACRVFNEDEFVQLTDRITLLGNSALSQVITEEALRAKGREKYDRLVLRRALKLVGLACGRIAVEALDRNSIVRVISGCFDRAFDEIVEPSNRKPKSTDNQTVDDPATGASGQVSSELEFSFVEEEYLRHAGNYRKALLNTLGACDFKDAVDLLDSATRVLKSRSKPHKSRQLSAKLRFLVDNWLSLTEEQQSVAASTLRFSAHNAQTESIDHWRILDAPEKVIQAAYVALGV